MIVLAVIYPLLLVLLPSLGAPFSDYPYLAVPVKISPEFFVRSFITAAILVSCAVGFGVPLLSRVFHSWLHKSP